MTSGAWRLALVATAMMLGGGTVALIAAVRLPLDRTFSDSASAPSALPAGARSSARPPDSLVARSGLFRPSRAPAPIPFDPGGQQTEVPPVAPAPAFTLVGLALGPTPTAVISGIPGHEGAQVLAEGDELGGARLIRVEAAGVVLVWRADTVRLALPKEGS
jgi:hypothetical protein